MNAPVPSTHSSLLRRMRARDGEAWRTFVQRYQPLIIRWCREAKLQDADADEVTAQVLLKLYEHIGSYRRERGLFRVWLKTVVENTRRGYARRLRRQAVQRQADPKLEERIRTLEAPADPDSMVQAVDHLAAADLERAMAASKERVEAVTWEVFRLTVLERRPAAEAAKTLGLTVAKVYVYKGRVCKKIVEELTKLANASDEADP